MTFAAAIVTVTQLHEHIGKHRSKKKIHTDTQTHAHTDMWTHRHSHTRSTRAHTHKRRYTDKQIDRYTDNTF